MSQRLGGTSPTTPLSPPVGTPTGIFVPGHGRAGSISSIDDSEYDYESHATPRTTSYFPPQHEPSRRVSEMRGTGTPQGPMSPPSLNPATAGSGGLGRSARPRMQHLKDGERTAPVSRSASRVRLPGPHQPQPTIKDKDLEDDEVQVIDRGEDLIRRRIKERKRAKRERERRLAAAEFAESEMDEPGAVTTATAANTSAPSSAGADAFTIPFRAAALSPVRAPHGQRAASRQRAASSSRRSSSGYTRSGSVSDIDRAESFLSVPTEENTDDLGDEEVPEEEEDADMLVHSDDTDEQHDDDEDEDGSNEDDEGVTVKDRQDAINLEHPFGLPIWKPALYRKSRSVTRNAESALHSMPSASAERHLLPGNLLWTLLFGWWLALSCFFVALIVSTAELVAGGRGGYGKTLRGLAWYLGWPFGKYVEGEGAPDEPENDLVTDEENANTNGGANYGSIPTIPRTLTASTSSSGTVRAVDVQGLVDLPDEPTTPHGPSGLRRPVGVSFAEGVKPASPSPTPSPTGETAPLLKSSSAPPIGFRKPVNSRAKFVGSLFYWPGFLLIVAPVMSLVCIVCWFLVITIPMAKLTWELLVLLYTRPLEINFRSAPEISIATSPESSPELSNGGSSDGVNTSPNVTLKRQRLKAGQVAPTAGPTSTVLLCTYRAIGWQYYKYTVGGVNIMFINLLPLVFFTILDGMLLLPAVERAHHEGRRVAPILDVLASQALIFVLGLASVIPLSYFIGMAVASISAQSSIGMGAVINATFGSIIEIVLYSIALTQGKGRLVEGSIVGSILAGVLLMPGMSMCSGALKRKEQKFNAKSAGVTSTMLIMAIIGTLTPTMFYQTYGTFQIHCDGCPEPGEVIHDPSQSWKCNSCYYEYPDPITDPFYQNQVKTLMYACAAILLLSYLIGLWFSLRTHASQIWQNPQQVMVKEELPAIPRTLARITPANIMNPILPVHNNRPASVRAQSPHPGARTPTHSRPTSPYTQRKALPLDSDNSPHASIHASQQQQQQPPYPSTGYTPLLDSYNPKPGNSLEPLPLPAPLTHEEFRRAVHTLTAVGALQAQPQKVIKHVEEEADGHGGHEAPSWTRGMSAAVLLGCTVLYAAIAEILVDVVDVVLNGSGVDEKFLGLTLFALVPNTTEFMNAMSFAMNGNIALR